jgi:hypothetical protein
MKPWEVLKAVDEGKTVQVESYDGHWDDRDPSIGEDLATYNWRIKREPREFKVWIEDGKIYQVKSSDDNKVWINNGWKQIAVVEKLDA